MGGDAMRLLELYNAAQIHRQPAALVAYLSAVRAAHGLSVEGLASLLLVSVSTLRHWRQGTRMPSTPAQWRSLQRLADPDPLDVIRIEAAKISHPGRGRPKQVTDEEMQRRAVAVFGRLIGDHGSEAAVAKLVATELGVTELTVRRWMWPTPIGWERLRRIETLAGVGDHE